MKRTRSTSPALLLGALVLAACQGEPTKPIDRPIEPPTPVKPTEPAATTKARAEILAELAAVKDLSKDGLLTRYPTSFESISYDPTEAANLTLIQNSAVALSGPELQKLGESGFVISEARRFPTFTHGYETLYLEDLPLFISADSILNAVHHSYDDILKAIELSSLIPDLRRMLTTMRTELADGAGSALGPQARADADTYVAVALSLLEDQIAAPVAGGSASDVQALSSGAAAASGTHGITLFGVERVVDFSQFKPRGHYTDDPELEKYFRAMMWLGRIDFRLVETKPDHSQVFHRRQLEGAFALQAALNSAGRASWQRLDRTIEGFVGESDNMTLNQLDVLLEKLGVTRLDQLAEIEDARIAETILVNGLGTQRISSHFMVNGLGQGTMPLSSTFLLLGQRYVIDSHVFSNVVYDRVQGGSVLRMMPNPLDVAFAALGNDQAAKLLERELDTYHYAPDLAAMRILSDAHEADFWQKNLYNLWLSALRSLSLRADSPTPIGSRPEVARTEAWGKRVLNTQLASWAELRHDTILYAKQSYTGGVTCEFPDAQVEPVPEVFSALEDFARHGQGIVAGLELSGAPYLQPLIEEYFDRLLAVSSMLREMAEYQRDGRPFEDYHLAFVNEAVRIHWGCGAPEGAEGWYPRLFFNASSAAEYDPTIADVHTQPTDEGGAVVGRILHVGTGMARLMVVTMDTCTGPKAYAGLVSSYFEKVTENFERYDDPTWAAELQSGTPPDVAWMTDLVVR